MHHASSPCGHIGVETNPLSLLATSIVVIPADDLAIYANAVALTVLVEPSGREPRREE